MEKAIFFSGCGTAYSVGTDNFTKKKLELYPETVPALRFLHRRGYLTVLISPELQEYKLFQSSLKDKTLMPEYWNGREEDLDILLEEQFINVQESYFVTDGSYLQEWLQLGWQKILVLTGKGVATLDSLETEQLKKICDVCKDIYAAAISIAIHK